jgi:hypothetical protein
MRNHSVVWLKSSSGFRRPEGHIVETSSACGISSGRARVTLLLVLIFLIIFLDYWGCSNLAYQ